MRDRRYIDIYVRERGPEHLPEHSIEIDATYDEDFKDALKSLPFDVRAWDAQAARWRVRAAFLLSVTELAKKYYANARLVEGDVTTDLHTGQKFEQKGLFG